MAKPIIGIKVDPAIMQELLDQPNVRANVAKMTPKELEWFKEVLVSKGVYARYVLERQKQQIAEIVKPITKRKRH